MPSFKKADVIVVGAGLFGLTIAERLANDLGKSVVVLESREHIGGNAFSYFDHSTGIEVHKYGSHIFHTSHERVWNYVRNFTEFNSYQHSVISKHNGDFYEMPINLNTINKFFQQNFDSKQAEAFIRDLVGEPTGVIENLEDKAISLVGQELFEAFIKNYTAKQWQTDPKELSADIITRLPFRFDTNARYFDDLYEGQPLNGYTAWLQNMVSSPLIDVHLSCDYFSVLDEIDSDQIVIYTGPVDQFFGFEFGQLGWRTLDFEFEHIKRQNFQGCAVVNYADLDVEYTRVHEFKYFNPERTLEFGQPSTVIAREYSRFATIDDEPFYPINTSDDREKLINYRKLQNKLPNVYFGGRLGTYKYLDMHMAIASALTMFDNDLKPRLSSS